MSFASPTLTGQFYSVCPRRLQRLVAVNTANKQSDVIIDFCLLISFWLEQAAPETDIRRDGFVVKDHDEGRSRTGRLVDVFSFQRKRSQGEKTDCGSFMDLVLGGVVSCAREMEAKLDQTQTEKNREKNQEHFSLERIKKAGEQQQDFGDEQKHKSHQTKAACVLFLHYYIL